MKFSVISIFPDLLSHYLSISLPGKAIQKNIFQVDIHELRSFAVNKHKKVDDRPFGGGAGMVMTPDPLFRAVEHIQAQEPGRVILFSAYGTQLNQEKIKTLAQESHLILVCGRYEGVDQRFIDHCVDEELSIGPYVLMGGELPALIFIEAVSRMLPGVVGNPDSVMTDSFYFTDQLAFPQYTQPREYRGFKVPEVLLNGNHRMIEEWRAQNQKNQNPSSTKKAKSRLK